MENPVPKKRLSLPTILVSIFCVAAIIFGKDIAYGAISITISLLNLQLSLANIAFILSNMTIFGLVVSGASAAILAACLLRSRLQIDLPKTKKQIMVVGTTLAIGLFLVSSLFVPSSLATNFTATASYHLQTPLPIAEAYVGQYTNTSYFYINGATWANALVNSNKTLVQETAINAVTSGNVWSEVSFDYVNLACPANVSFTEHVNGVERTFGNLANSQGSPMTISAGTGADVNQYFAEDRKGTICITSTDVGALITQVGSVPNRTIYVNDGDYTFGDSVIELEQDRTELIMAKGAVFHVPDSSSLLWYFNVTGTTENRIHVKIQGGEIDGNKANNTPPVPDDQKNGVLARNCQLEISNMHVYNCSGLGIVLSRGTQDSKIIDNTCEDNYAGGIMTTWNYTYNSGNRLIQGNTCIDNDGSATGRGIYVNNGQGETIIDNHVNGNPYGITAHFAQDLTIANNEVSNSSIKGIDVGSSSDITGKRIIIEGNTVKDCIQGAIVLADCPNSIITGNTVEGNNTGNGITVINGQYQTVTSNAINNFGSGLVVWSTSDSIFKVNTITDSTTYGVYGLGTSLRNSVSENKIRIGSVGIGIRETSDYWTVEHNDISSITYGSANCITYTLTHNTIQYNQGFKTENLVIATNTTATTFVITTGLTLDNSVGVCGNVTFASFDFDQATVSSADFKYLGWTQTTNAVITVTVSGSSLPATMTCRANLIFKP